jgi:hypothetical protein
MRDQGVFVSRPAIGNVELTARLVSLSANVGGPNAYPWDNRPPSASGLMIRESVDDKCSRYFLIQVEATGNLVCRWRDKSGDQDDNQSKSFGAIAVPTYLRLVLREKSVEVFASVNGREWGQALMSHPVVLNTKNRIGLFVSSGNTFVSSKAEFDSVTVIP